DYPDKALEVLTELHPQLASGKVPEEEVTIVVRLEATARMKKNDFAGAEKLLREALQAQPGNVTFLDNLSYLYLRNGEYGKGRQVISQWLEKKPNHVSALRRRSVIEMRERQFAEALETLDHILKIEP